VPGDLEAALAGEPAAAELAAIAGRVRTVDPGALRASAAQIVAVGDAVDGSMRAVGRGAAAVEGRWRGTGATAFGDWARAFAAAAPLYDSTRLNIGLNCRWEQKCISAQTRAMERALVYVKSHRPPQSSIHLCNRNARRARYRVDWIGFYNCIRNPYLHYR